jgi:CheY-like chemotaxis protein
MEVSDDRNCTIMVTNGNADIKGREEPSDLECHERVEVWSIPEPLLPGSGALADAPPLRALLAEDNLIDQVNTRRLLEKQGFEVICAANGFEAVDRFGAGRYAIVLLDILMPEMDGFEASSRIRERELQYGRTPIIALTSYSLGAVFDKCKSVGMNGFLSKPVSEDELGELFDKLGRNLLVGNVSGNGNSTAVPEQLPVLDVNGSLDNLGGDRGLYLEIITMFAECAPKAIHDLDAAIMADDRAQIAFYAHNLKGMSASIGAKRLTELACSMHEPACLAGRGDPGLWKARLRDEFEAVMDAIACASETLSP